MSDETVWIWIDGKLVDAERATVSAFDHGITVGDGIFETMKVVTDDAGDRQGFALRRHLDRLRRSAQGLGLPVAMTDAELRAAVHEVLDANPATAGRVRITITGGIGPLGSDRGEAPPTILVATSAAKPWPPSAAVAIVGWRRNEHSPVAGIKTTSYAENVVALDHAHQRGASEAIFANTAGLLCEGTGSNVFVGIAGRLITPPLRSGCLAGVTRELLLDATSLGIVEEDLPIDALRDADEAFITSSTRDVMPVHAVDDHALPRCPGPLTAAAAHAFAALEAASVDP